MHRLAIAFSCLVASMAASSVLAQGVGGSGGTAGGRGPFLPTSGPGPGAAGTAAQPATTGVPIQPTVGPGGGTAGYIAEGTRTKAKASVTREEFLKDAERMFDKYDTKRTGRIDLEKREKMLKEMMK